ncbi:MAG: hypothetical protein HN348_06890, partial [Proteobacteria bacterium]|nr:hypothetical protein [Pseudomonadota bacterium]
RVHYWIDLLVELPLVLTVVATGLVMLIALWPLTWLHFIKIGLALVAVVANIYCITQVIERHRGSPDGPHTGRIYFSGAAIPFALVAAMIGLLWFHGGPL